jgi:chromosomal replication initiator protein
MDPITTTTGDDLVLGLDGPTPASPSSPPPSPSPSPAGPWDDLVIGPEVALAVTSLRALAAGDRDGLSPLVLHGPPGVGKTRLLAAVVAEARARRPDARAVALTAEAFAAACAAAAVGSGGWSALRGALRESELIGIDDLTGLARQPLALVELSHTLDALEAAGAAVVVTSRSAPGQWSELPPRLASRLAGGLAIRLDPPGPESRRRYVLARSRALGARLPSSVVEALAQAADGYRSLDGLLARYAIEGRGRDPDPDRPPDVAALLAEPDAVAPATTIDDVARAVAARFRVPLRSLRSGTRRAAVVAPRHLAIHLARSLTTESVAAIGRYFGRRDPATIRHACRMAEKRLADDPSLAAAAAAIAVGFGPNRHLNA